MVVNVPDNVCQEFVCTQSHYLHNHEFIIQETGTKQIVDFRKDESRVTTTEQNGPL